MKAKNVWALVPLLLIFLFACKDDDVPIVPEEEVIEQPTETPVEEEEEPTEDPAVVLANERTEAIANLTGGTEKTWKIASAILNNSTGAYDISSNFNVTDDEFVFRSASVTGKTEFEGSLEWRQNNAIAPMATSAEGAKLDFYTSPEALTFDFEENSATAIFSSDEAINLTANGADEWIGTITLTENASLDVVLIPKSSADFQQVPTAPLVFTTAFTFTSNSVDSGAVGMVGSLADNSFFVALRDENPNGNFNEERVLRFDLTSNAMTESFYDNPDFVTKQLIPHNGKLLVVGGQRINSYNLDLSGTPTSLQEYRIGLGLDYLGLSRFGTAMVDGDILIFGGELDNVATEIYAYDLATQQTEIFAELPAPRFGARGEVVNNTLYIFGGTEEFFTPPANNTIFIYDLVTQSFVTESMPKAVNLTYTGKIENLIYVAGRIDSYDENNITIDREPFLGVYDTTTGQFQELETNLESPALETIHSMAVFDNVLYILYGQGNFVEGETQTWSILAADL